MRLATWIALPALLGVPSVACAQDDNSWDEFSDAITEMEQVGGGALGTVIEEVPFYETLRNAASNNPDHWMSNGQKAGRIGLDFAELSPWQRAASGRFAGGG